MRTIVGSSTKKTKEIKTERIVNLDPNNSPVPTNVSQYGAGGTDIQDMQTAKHFASEAEKSAKDAASSAGKSENFYRLTLDAAKDVQENTADSFNYLEEIRQISVKIDGQEDNIDEAEKQVILHATAAENAAQIASDSAVSARASEANSAASASSANNSAVSSKESEQIAVAAKDYAIGAATEGHQILAQTEAVYDKTIDDVSKAVQSYLKDKGGFEPSAGLPEPDSWFDIFGVEKKLSCLWVADKAGTIPTTGVGFNEGDILIYNSIVDRYGRFSGELVTGGGGGGATEFFNDIKLAADKRLLGTDTNGSSVELIKLANDIVEAGDKTKPMHILAKDPKSAFVCIANAVSGFDNYQIYHSGNKPTAADVGAYTKTESDGKFVDTAGDMMTGLLNTTNTIQIKSKEVYHPGNKPAASDVDAVSLTKSEVITGRKSFSQNPIIENNTPTLSLKEADVDAEVLIKVEDRTLSVSTSTTKPFDVDLANNIVLMANPRSKTVQDSTPDALVRKDYTDTELSKKLNNTGNNTLSGDLIITGKVTVEGTGSIFKDINTTGQVKENNIRVYSPANKPTAIDVGALPISGGNVGGAVHVRGNLSTDGTFSSKGSITTEGTISERGQRVYSPNNKPTPADVGALPDILGHLDIANKPSGIFRGWVNGNVSGGGSITSYSGNFLNFSGAENHTSQILMGSGDLQFRTAWGETPTPWYKVYHTGNKPTAADVGAIGIDNVYDKTQADARFWKRTETVNRSFSTEKVNTYAANASTFKDELSLRSYNVVPGNAGYPNLGSGIFQGRKDGVKNQGWSLFNDFTSDRFFLGKQAEDGSGFTWSKVYTESQKPSAIDVGALPLSGGVMSGPMVMANNSTLDGHNTVARFDNSPNSYTHYYSDLSGNATQHDFRFADGKGSFVTYSMGGSGAIFSDTEGRFYSQGFKPTAVDVGALPLTGGTMLGVIKNETTHGTILSGGVGFLDLLGVNDKDNAGGAYFGKDGYWLRTGNAANQPKIIRNNTEYEIYHQGNKPTAADVGAYSVSDFTVETGAAADTVVRRTGTGGIHNNGLTSPGSVRVNLNPDGTRLSGGASEVGSIKITLPTTGSECMLKIYVSVYNYKSDTSFEAVLSGYDSSPTDSNIWYECSAVINGAASTPNHPVYFGKEGDKSCIWVGSVGQGWAYPQVTITKVESGYNGGNKELWTTGWDVSLVTELGQVVRTISDALLKPGGANIPADEQPTANTLVKRNSLGEVAAKGRLLIASNNDSDVGAGMAYVDFVSSAGNSYGSVGDVSGVLDMRLTSNQGWAVVDGNAGSTIQQGGIDVARFRNNNIELLSKTTITVPNNNPSLLLHNGGGWSYLEIKSGVYASHIALNDGAIDGGIAGSLHLRPAGTNLGSLILQPNSLMKHQSPTGFVGIGSANASYVHFQTDRPKYHFDQVVEVQGEIYTGANHNMRVYHQGFKPTPAEISAHEVKPWITSPGMDANDAGNYTAFTYGNNAPYSGPLVSMGVNRYTMQFNSTYGGTQSLAFRTHNGDNSTWNPWQTIYTSSNKPTPAELGAVPLSGGTMAGNLHASNGGFYPVTDNASELGNSGWRWNTGFIVNLNTDNAVVNNGLTIAQTGGVGNGLSLYGSSTTADPEYGLMFATTANFGAHGAVTGDWATYFNMNGVLNRGWIFRHKGSGNVASISGNGDAWFSNSVTTGTVNANNVMTGDITSSSWLRNTGNGGWYNATHGGGINMTNNTWVEVYGNKKFYVANTAFDSIQVGGGILLANGSLDNTGCGITGVYDATRFQGVFAMGHQYMLPQNGIGGGTLYGITWTHSNNPSAEARKVSGHQMCIMDNGITYVAAGTGGIWANGTINSNSYMNAVAAGGSWGHGNSSGFTVSNGTSPSTAYNLVGVPGGARIQALGGTGGTVRIYPNNGSTHFLDISNSGIQTSSISASGRITTSAGFSGDGSGLTNVPFGQIRSTETLLFNDPVGLNGGNFVLSQAYSNFKAIVFYMSDDGSNYMYSFTKTVEELNRLQAFGKPYGVISDANYHWVGRFNSDNRTFVTRVENGRMWQVTGVN